MRVGLWMVGVTIYFYFLMFKLEYQNLNYNLPLPHNSSGTEQDKNPVFFYTKSRLDKFPVS